MPKYNIIYTSPDDDLYLWNGSSLSKLEKTGQEALHFSGTEFKDDDLANGVNAAKEAAEKMHPNDADLNVKTIEIKVA